MLNSFEYRRRIIFSPKHDIVYDLFSVHTTHAEMKRSQNNFVSTTMNCGEATSNTLDSTEFWCARDKRVAARAYRRNSGPVAVTGIKARSILNYAELNSRQKCRYRRRRCQRTTSTIDCVVRWFSMKYERAARICDTVYGEQVNEREQSAWATCDHAVKLHTQNEIDAQPPPSHSSLYSTRC